MENSLQQQKQKKQGQTSPSEQAVTQDDGQKIGVCPKCNAELPEEAAFCPECGFSIKQRVCPKCGSPATPTADICQICGAWLLEGKCKFCYADLSSSDALFCPECGKPKDGIPCPHCGTLSIFDFCSKCGKPVTEEAIAELKHAQEEIESHVESDDPEAEKKTFSTNQDARRWFNAQAAAQTAEIEAELAKLDELIKIETETEETEEEAPVQKRKSLFSDRQMASIRKTGAIVDEITRKREEAERIAEEKRKAQERKEELERRLRARAWRCNAYGVVHAGGPNECGDPSLGGHWV